MRFLPWHLGFFCRYRPFPRDEFEAESREHPLMQTRQSDPDDLPVARAGCCAIRATKCTNGWRRCCSMRSISTARLRGPRR